VQVRATNGVGGGVWSASAETTPRFMRIRPTSLTLPEGSNGSYSVNLTSPPTGVVTVTPSVPAGTDVSFLPETLSFGTSNWSRVQTVTAADDPDAVTDGDVTISHSASGGGYDSSSFTSATVSITENDSSRGGGGGGSGGDGGGTPPPSGGGGGGGPGEAEIATDAACADGLCRVRTGVAVEFRDTAGGFGSRLWDFGDGTLSRSATVTHSWAEPGFYTVTLEKSGGGARSAAAMTFLVEAAHPAGTCAPDAETLCQLDSRFEVTDTATGVVREYRNEPGEPATGIADPVAFPESCPELAASRAPYPAPAPPRRRSAPLD